MSALLNHIVWTFGSLVIVICLLFGFYYLVLITRPGWVYFVEFTFYFHNIK